MFGGLVGRTAVCVTKTPAVKLWHAGCVHDFINRPGWPEGHLQMASDSNKFEWNPSLFEQSPQHPLVHVFCVIVQLILQSATDSLCSVALKFYDSAQALVVSVPTYQVPSM